MTSFEDSYRYPKVHELGWGFLTAWGLEGMVIASIFSGGSGSFSIGVAANLSSALAYLGILVVSIVATEDWLRTSTISMWFQLAAFIAMFLGSLLYAFALADGASPIIRLLALSLASVGHAVLIVAWGRHYATLDAQDVETNATWSMLVCAICYLLVIVTVNIASVIIWLAMPVASYLCLLRCEKLISTDKNISCSEDDDTASSGEGFTLLARQASSINRTSLVRVGCLALIANFIITFSLNTVALTALGSNVGLINYTNLSGLVLSAFLVIYCTVFARRVSLIASLTLLCPLAVLGLFLISLQKDIIVFIGYGLLFAAQWVLYLFLWIHLANLAQRQGTRSTTVFSLGLTCFETGSLIGFVAGGLISREFSQTGIAPVFLFFGSAVIFVLLTLAFMRLDENENPQPDVALPTPSIDQLMVERCQTFSGNYGLSPRESEVLQYLVRGYSLPHIRNELFISKSTIESHVHHIYQKCGIHSRAELIGLFEKTR